MKDNPLDLAEHLRLRSQLSSVASSSIMDIWKASPAGKKCSNLIRFFKTRTGPGKLSSGEFIQFGFCDTQLSDREIARFAGKRMQQAFNKIYNDKTWYAVTKHKVLFETLMKGANLPCPQTVAIYDRKGRGAGAEILQTRAELEGFLRKPENLPLFAKPTTGLLSIGSFRIDAVKGETLVINGCHELPVAEVCDYVQGLSKKGYLFQKVLIPHASMVKLHGDAIASARFVVFNREEEALLDSCVLKLPSEGEVADNFWRPHSVICAIHNETGEIKRATINDMGTILQTVTSPVTGMELIGYQLPDYEQAVQIVLQAARNFPGIKVQSWDVAFTHKGPLLLEVNYGGDLNLSQIASGKGIMNPQYCKILRESGFKGTLID